jgi:hypothetical protein
MYSNQQPSIYKTEHYSHDSQSNSLSFNQLRPSLPSHSHQPPTLTTYFHDKSNLRQQQSTGALTNK